MSEIRVSAFPDHAAPRVWVWLSSLRGTVMDDFGPRDMDEFLQVWMRDKLSQRFEVLLGDRVLAVVSFSPWNCHCGAIQVVVPPHMFRSEDVARGVRMAVLKIFEQGYGKVMAFPMVQATSLIRALKMVPFRREGTLRQQTFRFGKLVDVAVFGATPEFLQSGASRDELECATSNSGVSGGGTGRQVSEADQPVLQ